MTESISENQITIKATKGILWNLTETLGQYAVQFLFSIILARLLLPAQFGLIGMLSIFILLSQSLLDSGFGNALIQKKDTSQLDICSVFYFNLVIGAFLTCFLWLVAPFIAQFYAQPILVQLTRLLSLVILINALRLVPSVIIIKRMDFKAMFKIGVVAVVVSGIVGICMAFSGFGVWSLAVQSVIEPLIRMLLVWRASRWKPAWVFSTRSLKTMFSFGSRLMVVGLLDTFFNNIYQLFIGKVFSATDLGYYVRAQSMQTIAVQPASGTLVRVTSPALSPIQEDKIRLKKAYQKIMTTAVFFHFPLMIMLIVIAEPLFTLLFTQRWLPSVHYFQLFCLVGLFWPLQVLNLNILQVIGKSKLYLRLEIIRKLLIVLAIVFTYRMGINALLLGQIATSVAAYGLNSYYCGKLIDYTATQQIHDTSPYLFIAIVMGIASYFVGSASGSILLKLLLQITAGVVLYLGMNFLLDHSIMREVIRLFRNVIGVPDLI